MLAEAMRLCRAGALKDRYMYAPLYSTGHGSGDGAGNDDDDDVIDDAAELVVVLMENTKNATS